MHSLILITCPKRITPYLSQELKALGYTVEKEFTAGVAILGSMKDCMKLNLYLRTAHRVLFLLKSFKAHTPENLYHFVWQLPWEDIIPNDGYVAVISSVQTESINNSQFANVKCKDAIVDRIRAKTHRRPSSGSATDKAVIFLYWHGDKCSVYIDTSGESLSNRGYRRRPHLAPLRETLAAAIIMASGWDKKSHFINPMCGSGTLAIEAAMIALDKPPGSIRTNFGFMHLITYNKDSWFELISIAKRREKRTLPLTIMASDRDPNAIEAVLTNSAVAEVNKFIAYDCCDFRETDISPGEGIVMINPEYGLRLGEHSELEETYSQIGDFFKQNCKGKRGYVFTGNMELAKKIGLKASRRIELYNADVDCRLFEYELYEGSRRIDERKPEKEA